MKDKAGCVHAMQPDEPDLLEQREVDADQPAYSISPTNFHGSSSLRTAMLDDNELYFAIDWEASAALEYDPECMDVPQLHSSTEEARARHKEGPKPFTLQECLEVSTSALLHSCAFPTTDAH